MALAALFSLSPVAVIGVSLLGILLYRVLKSKQYKLDHIPGPFLAKYTDAWRAYKAWKFNHFKDGLNYQTELLGRYGDIVRIGPNTVLVLDPEAINSVLGFKERLEKGPGYKVFVLGGEYGDNLDRCRDNVSFFRRHSNSPCWYQRRGNAWQISTTDCKLVLAFFSKGIRAVY